MEYILYNSTTKHYLEDDETLKTSKNLQRAMIVTGDELAQTLLHHFPSYEKKLIGRPKKNEPSYIALM